MKPEVQVRRDAPVLLIAVAVAAIALLLLGRWLEAPELAPDHALSTANLAVVPLPTRIQEVGRDDHRRAPDQAEPPDACLAMTTHVASLVGTADARDTAGQLRALCHDADLSPAFVACATAAGDVDAVVDCAIVEIPEEQHSVFERAAVALHPDLDLTDAEVYQRAIDEILDDLDDDQREQVSMLIHRANRAAQEDEPWQP